MLSDLHSYRQQLDIPQPDQRYHSFGQYSADILHLPLGSTFTAGTSSAASAAAR